MDYQSVSMDYHRAVMLSAEDRRCTAQGLLASLASQGEPCRYILLEALSGYRAQHIVAEQMGEPGNRFGVTVQRTADGIIIICLGGWEELGVFTAREPVTETEKMVFDTDWAATVPVR